MALRLQDVSSQEWSCDGASFDAVYDRHAAAVYAVACRFGGASSAADLTQDVFVRLWRDPNRFDPERGSLRTFLVAVTRNLAIDRARSDTSSRRRDRRVASDRGLAPPILDLNDVIVRSSEADRVIAAIRTLSVPCRDAIVTAFYGGLTYRETASVLSEPEGTIKSRIRDSLGQLRKELAQSS